MRTRTSILIAVISMLLASALPGGVRAEGAPPAVSDGSGPLDTAADLEAALHFEHRLLDHFHYGQTQNQYYRTAERVFGDVERSVHEGDSGLYTGSYLSAQSYRFALAKQELAKAAPGSDAFIFWKDQLNEARSRIRVMVDKYHLLINISRNWETTFDPKVNDDREPTDDGFIDFGGGVVPPEAGLLFRVCNPTDAPAEFNIGLHFAGTDDVVTLPWEDGKTYHCVGNTSRDQYAGATFGLTTALDLVGPHDKALRKRVAEDLMAMTDYAVKYLMFQPRPHGSVVTTGNDLQGPVSPLFFYTPYARMNMLQVGRNAARKLNDTLKLARYDVLWDAELATQLPQLQASMEIDASGPHDAYYKYHLNHLTGDDIIRHEPNVQVRNLIRQSFAVMDATTGDDGNALFEAMTYALTGDPDRLAAAVQHHREWLDYRANADANQNIVDFTPECGTTIECVPTDRVDMVQTLPNGDEIVVPKTQGTSTRPRSTTPRPVALRRPADFLWQKDPTILIGCGGGIVPDCNPSVTERWEGDGTDFLQVYWMIRYYTEVQRPARQPFQPWAGPTFR